jgi:nucleotide-binding universal stress UspA family protein
MARRILHPTDFSPASRGALTKAIEMAKADRGQLMILHVINPIMPVEGEGYVSPKMYEQLASSTRAWARKRLATLAARAKKAGVRVTILLAEGTPHEQIIRAARSKRADLIVMGTHGRSGLAKLFLGSVAGRVVTAAPGPVLTVRAK